MDSLVTRLQRLAKEDGIDAVCVGAVISRGGRVLILIRSEDNMFLPGCGDLPGGYVVVGESVFAALDREIREETGFTISRIVSYLGSFDFVTGHGRRARQLNFEVEVQGNKVVLTAAEHSDFRWCDPVDELELRRLRVSSEVRAVLRSARF